MKISMVGCDMAGCKDMAEPGEGSTPRKLQPPIGWLAVTIEQTERSDADKSGAFEVYVTKYKGVFSTPECVASWMTTGAWSAGEEEADADEGADANP